MICSKGYADMGSTLFVVNDEEHPDAVMLNIVESLVAGSRNANVGSISSIEIFTHAEWCVEELNVEKRVRKKLMAMTSSFPGVSVKFSSYWGGSTATHIDDLGFDPRGKQMPEFKGEFNRV